MIPAHKPRTFPEAVESLRTLDAALATGKSDGSIDHETLEKAVDVAGWLAELAAESDMPEGPWNEVDRIGSALVAEYRTRPSSVGPGHPATTSAEHLRALREIAAAANPVWFDPPAKAKPSTVVNDGPEAHGRSSASAKGEGQ